MVQEAESGTESALYGNQALSLPGIAERASDAGVYSLPGGDAGSLLQQRLRAGPDVQPGNGAAFVTTKSPPLSTGSCFKATTYRWILNVSLLPARQLCYA